MKEKRCKDYCGVTCVGGHCPIALYNEDFTMFERKPSCDDCPYYKGCEDCYLKGEDCCFKGKEMCAHTTEKGGSE